MKEERLRIKRIRGRHEAKKSRGGESLKQKRGEVLKRKQGAKLQLGRRICGRRGDGKSMKVLGSVSTPLAQKKLDPCLSGSLYHGRPLPDIFQTP